MTTYAFKAVEAIRSRVKAMSAFSGFTFAETPEYEVQPESIPFCGIFFVNELLSPDGDPNAGEIRHRSTVRVGFSIIIENNDPEAAEQKLDEIYESLMGNLMTDVSLYHGSDVRFQAFPSGDRLHRFGDTGQENELPIVELELHLNCDLGAIIYPPVVDDVLRTIHVETAFPLGADQAERDSVQQVVAQYDISQGYEWQEKAKLRGAGSLRANATVTP